jgi:hypothetical protein
LKKRIALSGRPIDGLPDGLAFMATNFLTKIFGSRNDRLLKQYRTQRSSASTHWSLNSKA